MCEKNCGVKSASELHFCGKETDTYIYIYIYILYTRLSRICKYIYIHINMLYPFLRRHFGHSLLVEMSLNGLKLVKDEILLSKNTNL